MRVFRFWWDIPISTVIKATYALVPTREIRDDSIMFDEIVAAIKKMGCSWVMQTFDEIGMETSPGLSDTDNYNHRAVR